jgi:hypothetical protein
VGRFIADSSLAVRLRLVDKRKCNDVMNQKEVLIYTSHQSSHWRHTRGFLRQRGCDFDVCDTTDDAVLRAWLAHYFSEEWDRR